MEKIQPIKYLILIYGIPASGKTYLSKQIKQIINVQNKKVKLISVDCIQSFLISSKNVKQGVEELRQILIKNPNWQQQIQKHQIQRNNFSSQIWRQSRQFIRNFQILNYIFFQGDTDFLIIQDQMLLKSQRKPFRRYCFQQKIKFLDFVIEATLDEALLNNQKRSKGLCKQQLNAELIKKNLQKLQIDQTSVKISSNRQQKMALDLNFICENSYFVLIVDNHKQNIQKQLLKQQIVLGEKQLDEKQIRDLISNILKYQVQGNKYFDPSINTKERALLLAKAKKLYIQKKRKAPFLEILKGLIGQ